MKRLFMIFVLFVIVVGVSSYLFPGKNILAATTEEALKTFLVDYERAWNKQDIESLTNFYHDDAKIMTGRERKTITKAQYADVLPERFERVGSMKCSSLKIKIAENKAEVKIVIDYSRALKGVKFIFYMIRENGQWLIAKTEY